MALRRSPARKDILFRRFDATLGRDEILAALEVSGDQRARRLLAMMCDPAYSRYTLAKLCERVGLRHHALLDLFRRAKLYEAMLRMTKNMPQVMEDVAMDALSKATICRRCSGKGEVSGLQCIDCGGNGRTSIPGDAEARRLLFRALGLIRGQGAAGASMLQDTRSALEPRE